MVRKQLYLEAEQEERLKAFARQLGISEAELIRQLLDREFERGEEKLSRLRLLDPKAWEEEERFIEDLLASGPVRGRRRWKREDLYEDGRAR